ncbi:Protein export cytoplasm protein SecA ATPase RNA helicase [Candidatus Rhodobacter oscarellae]|uniref:Protein export cytoplasm protein SecA ATPase RNA helicase n=1 Tax=Candidatus Rhodobacter oscarellae TaxID=1675527 RepID=A0A0J9ECW0_9RHOB|nr:GNAT family N-acetyltransferase [Candidatus Rhodobacter lobularis]KMW60521.1 Protein export cytoplasm protein SecA ATPase RNA helicase [Candidatus Rhodobacter lobularis]
MTALHKIPTLTTERLVLRAPTMADFPAWAAFRADPVRSAGVGGPHGVGDAWEKFAEIIGHWHFHGFGRFLVADKSTDEPLGVVGPFHPPDWPEPEIAWSVFAAAEGKGVAFEAALASRRWAYETLGWTTVISMVMPGNTRSSKLAERIGCTRDPDYVHEDMGAMECWRHPGPGGAS